MEFDPTGVLEFIAYLVLAGCVCGFLFSLLMAVLFGPAQKE